MTRVSQLGGARELSMEREGNLVLFSEKYSERGKLHERCFHHLEPLDTHFFDDLLVGNNEVYLEQNIYLFCSKLRREIVL